MPWSMSTKTRAFIREKIKVARNEKRKKNYVGFPYSKNMANFEAFLWGIKLRINLLFLKSVKPKYDFSKHEKIKVCPHTQQMNRESTLIRIEPELLRTKWSYCVNFWLTDHRYLVPLETICLSIRKYYKAKKFSWNCPQFQNHQIK